MRSLPLNTALVAALLTSSAVATAQVCEWCEPLFTSKKPLKPHESWSSHHPVEADTKYYHRLSEVTGAKLVLSGDVTNVKCIEVFGGAITDCTYSATKSGTATAKVTMGDKGGTPKLEFGKDTRD